MVHKQNNRVKSYGLGVLVSIVVALVMATAGGAVAATIVVNSLADTQANNGACTLREAITNANADNQSGSTDCAAGSGADTITFSVGGTITLGSTLPTITSDITIDGESIITISGNHSVQVFLVTSGGSLNLQKLAVINGSSNSGGAIDNNGGTVTITDSTFSGNSAGVGGGIFNIGGMATITNSTFSGNSADFGGAIFNNSGMATITNSTFSGNSAEDDGGAIFNFSGTLTITNSTFSNNSAGTGGAINNSGPTATITNSIIANSPSGGNCSGVNAGNDGGNNIYSDTTCGFSTANNSKPSTNPLLDPAGLQNNGGPTQTIALCTGVNTPTGCTAISPAIDAGNNAKCAAAPVNNIDQRGFVRPVDGPDADSTPTCDIGSIESGAVPPPVINNLVTFATLSSTLKTTTDISGCPVSPGFVGKFLFSARLTDKTTSPGIHDLMAKVTTLTNGNLLLNADGGPGGVGAISTVAQAGQYSDGVLSPGEFVDVPFIICLRTSAGFSFAVDVLGLPVQGPG